MAEEVRLRDTWRLDGVSFRRVCLRPPTLTTRTMDITHRRPLSLVSLAICVAAAGAMSTPGEEPMTAQRATGTFEVTRTPEWSEPGDGDVTLGRDRLEKRFEGDLEGIASGAMLTVVTPVQGSAGYVAIERVTATLHGRSGSFVLQHNGLLTRGEPALEITIVPDSGTGELEGIAGAMTISIDDGGHAYELVYTLP